MPMTPSGLGGANSLQAGTQNGPGPGSAQPFDLVKNVQDGYAQAQAQHSKLMESFKRMQVVRGTLDSLAKLGDAVTPEDVIKGAGAMVGAGFTPQVLAGLLASMPTQGGEAMQSWLAQQEQQVGQMEEQLHSAVVQSSLRQGGAAMAQLHVNHAREKLQAKQSQASPPTMNALTPTEGNA